MPVSSKLSGHAYATHHRARRARAALALRAANSRYRGMRSQDCGPVAQRSWIVAAVLWGAEKIVAGFVGYTAAVHQPPARPPSEYERRLAPGELASLREGFVDTRYDPGRIV